MHAESLTKLEPQSPPSGGDFFETGQIIQLGQRLVGLIDLHTFSERFVNAHENLMIEDTAIVLQAALSRDGEVFDPDKRQEEPVLTLCFDQRRRSENIYAWELIGAHARKRDVIQIETQASKNMTARVYRFNEQGGLKTESSLDGSAAAQLSRAIQQLAVCKYARMHVENLRYRQQKAKQNLTEYVQENFHRSSLNRYEKEVEKRRKHLDSIGFLAVKWYGR